ncbi:uncharacterized protein EAF01_003845 [Botrytis porri]|uniref:Uncharacterized protein n=1 Tax=Botrytis porri TaxID=87229 RepID=A0A4Z1KMI1_9HELO|nr:uncharacterized protein EAF01_003845 [Botrytis porri]KAF7908090.1 hypothetical protein EAF01_003845 [Botrytis porri]TGO84814.1 hypothetical protein BPOR_0462g00040 [Botrytis porri]
MEHSISAISQGMAKQLHPEILLDLEPNVSVSEDREKSPGSIHDTSEFLISFGDYITTLQQPNAVVIDERSQARNLGPQAIQRAFLSGDLDEPKAAMIGDFEHPIFPKITFTTHH